LAAAADLQALTLEAKIPLGNVRGRIDHLAIDVSRQRLLVAELGNDSLGIVDLRARRILTAVADLHEPQGVGYVPSTDTIWVANGGDGTLHLLRGDNGRFDAILPLGDDADNVRVDAKANRVYVGYGSGSIAIFDAITRNKVGELTLRAHPEGFQLDASAKRLYVNVPDAHQVAVVDLATERQSETWAMKGSLAANFPLTTDPDDQQVLVGYRSPATLVVYDMRTGASMKHLPICGDTDDIAWVAERHRAYVGCGEGFIDVIELSDDHAQRIARVPTVKGARTLLYSPDLDRLYVAIRATEQVPAAIWVFGLNP
jgi:DNA-binding beta-propeller fold protein YncE